jgi:hypothetical protein
MPSTRASKNSSREQTLENARRYLLPQFARRNTIRLLFQTEGDERAMISPYHLVDKPVRAPDERDLT